MSATFFVGKGDQQTIPAAVRQSKFATGFSIVAIIISNEVREMHVKRWNEYGRLMCRLPR
jgi:hypothetical protein